MCTTLELLTAVLVLVSCTQDCDDLLIGRERDRTRNLRTTSLCCLYDLSCCCIYSCMLIALDLLGAGESLLHQELSTPPGVPGICL